MKAAAFDYARPEEWTDALRLLAQGARPAAGTQSLGPMLNFRLAQPGTLADLRHLPDFAGVTVANDGTIRIGAGTTHADIEDGAVPGRLGVIMAAVARRIAYRAVRTRGTIGGSLAHADPAGDWVAVLPAIGGAALALGPGGERRIPLARFNRGVFTTALTDDELLRAIELQPLASRGTVGALEVLPQARRVLQSDRLRARRLRSEAARGARRSGPAADGDRRRRRFAGRSRTGGGAPRRRALARVMAGGARQHGAVPRGAGAVSRLDVSMTVNGRRVEVRAEPREHLADILRRDLLLTGTHLGCEHGVCGACTVELDGAPARSCIAFAGACDGAVIRTIEGFDDDPVMAQLREAFSAEHALQCGYCTPGMLITARAIVVRLPDADEARVREELAGNLCRCTGYRGIVRAILRVLAERVPT